jgi:hypothetical protein
MVLVELKHSAEVSGLVIEIKNSYNVSAFLEH